MGTNPLITDTPIPKIPDCYSNLNYDFLGNHRLIIASNRGPVTFEKDKDGQFHYNRGSGGLITALTGLLQNVDSNWIACAMTEADAEWREGKVSMDEGRDINVSFLTPTRKNMRGITIRLQTRSYGFYSTPCGMYPAPPLLLVKPGRPGKTVMWL